MADTLVLNQSWEPHQLMTWNKAFLLVLKGRVEIVLEHEDKDLTYGSGTIKMPSVVRLLKRVKFDRRNDVKFSRNNIYARDQQKCQYCGKHVPRHRLTWDHVVPRSRGGKSNWENLVVACEPCNSQKRDLTPEEAGMRRVYPVKPASLPGGVSFVYDRRMPVAWRQFFRDQQYWNGELDAD